jgi:hypothetical protein
MKNYRKNPTKLLQIRLSEQEYNRVIKFIKRFSITRREWLITVVDELQDMNIIRGGNFFPRHQEYAYKNNDKWDKKITEESKCENCGIDSKGLEKKKLYSKLERHHHNGYEGENAFKTIILCRVCHRKAEK